jgi:hypothetical protein
MIYAMIDLTSGRVVDLFPISGDQKLACSRRLEVFKKELADIYAKLTGDTDHQFKDLNEAKEAVIQEITKSYFADREDDEHPDSPGPVAIARRICDELAGHPRRDIIEACARAGVKRSTAATQYQKWKSAHQPAAN